MKKKTVVILHGWKLRGNVYDALKNKLEEKDYLVYVPDLPGFGSEPLVNDNMVLDDYVSYVRDFISKKKLQKPILIGHSFGGRIAVKFAFLHEEEIEKIILTGTPVIRHQGVKQNLGLVVAIIGRNFFSVFPCGIVQFMRKILYRTLGESDYLKAGSLKKVFVNIVNEDVFSYLAEVKIPVCLVWGQNDTFTPASDIVIIKRRIPNITVAVVANTGHKLPYENPDKFVKAIQKYL